MRNFVMIMLWLLTVASCKNEINHFYSTGDNEVWETNNAKKKAEIG